MEVLLKKYKTWKTKKNKKRCLIFIPFKRYVWLKNIEFKKGEFLIQAPTMAYSKFTRNDFIYYEIIKPIDS